MIKFYMLVEAMSYGQVTEGTAFRNTETGEQIIYTDGMLRHLTAGGYVTTGVKATDEMAGTSWEIVRSIEGLEPLTLLEALPFIAEGKEVVITVDGREHTVESLSDLEDVIGEEEFLSHLYYDADFYVVGKKEDKKDDSLTNVRKEHTGRKITASDAFRILHDRHFNKKSVAVIAEEHGITERMVYYVLDGTYWGGVWKDFHDNFDTTKDDYLL